MNARRLRDLVLLPVALVVVVLEDVVWAGLRALLLRLAGLPPLRRLELVIGHLPGWAALPLFLVPEGLGRAGELWALALLVGGHVGAAVTVYVLVRVVATLVAVFVFHACESTLLGYRWFARLVARVRRVRDWAAAMVLPWRVFWRARAGRMHSRLLVRFHALRRAYAVSRFRSGG